LCFAAAFQEKAVGTRRGGFRFSARNPMTPKYERFVFPAHLNSL
jgi:hypothetical protein